VGAHHRRCAGRQGRALHEAESQFGGVDAVITVATNGGELAWRVRSLGALRAVKEAGGIQVGDHVRIERLPDGESTGKGNPPSRYRVAKTGGGW
jgi:hypothetical protein